MVVAVVVAVSVEVSADVPLIKTEVEFKLQVGMLVGLEMEVVTAQVSATVPVNELDGVTVIVEVPDSALPELTAMLALLVRAKLPVTGASQNPLQPARDAAAISKIQAHFPILIHRSFCAALRRAPNPGSRVSLPGESCPLAALGAPSVLGVMKQVTRSDGDSLARRSLRRGESIGSLAHLGGAFELVPVERLAVNGPLEGLEENNGEDLAVGEAL